MRPFRGAAIQIRGEQARGFRADAHVFRQIFARSPGRGREGGDDPLRENHRIGVEIDFPPTLRQRDKGDPRRGPGRDPYS